MTVFVVRTSEVERTVDFFTQLGLSFSEEKHGEGPVHFACERKAAVFEIYPTDKKNTCKFVEGF